VTTLKAKAKQTIDFIHVNIYKKLKSLRMVGKKKAKQLDEGQSSSADNGTSTLEVMQEEIVSLKKFIWILTPNLITE
jgi:hypothetical protein